MRQILFFTLAIGLASSSTTANDDLDGLQFSERKYKNQIFIFLADNHPDYQITVETRAIGRKSGFYKVGDVLLINRFSIQKYEHKETTNNLGITVNVSELTILDQRTKRKFTLVLKEKVSWPDYFAEFRVAGNAEPFYVREGDSFNIPSKEGQFRLVEVGETEVKIMSEDEKITVLKKSAPAAAESEPKAE